jgi:hypothetical protein
MAGRLFKATRHQGISQDASRCRFNSRDEVLAESLDLRFVVNGSLSKFNLSLIMPVQGHDKSSDLQRCAF